MFYLCSSLVDDAIGLDRVRGMVSHLFWWLFGKISAMVTPEGFVLYSSFAPKLSCHNVYSKHFNSNFEYSVESTVASARAHN